MIKKTKTGFYIMGNNTYINENIVTEVGEDFVVKENIKYKYDNMGNITKVYENGELVTEYKYDALNRLVRENNKALNKTYVFLYDNKGNIIKKKE